MGSRPYYIYDISSWLHDADFAKATEKQAIQTAGEPPQVSTQHDPEVYQKRDLKKIFILSKFLFSLPILAFLNYHRKFAEIEAANHQLASALFSVDTESQRQSEVKSSHRHESEKNTKKGKRSHIYIHVITVDLVVVLILRIRLAVYVGSSL